jgi:DNA-binding NarL/FixJ family response regulator
MVKILIVEDNRFNRDAVREVLTRHFPSVVVEEASDGAEAMGKVESLQPDLVLMDIRLPDESGLELTKRIKATAPHIKVLITTAHHYPEYREVAAGYGADGFVVKGGSSAEFLQLIESFFPEAAKG